MSLNPSVGMSAPAWVESVPETVLKGLARVAPVNVSKVPTNSVIAILLFLTVTVSCGSRSTQNCTYFESSGLESGTCAAQICPKSINICQVRCT